MILPDIMIDIEALGLRAGSAVFEIAAVTFDPATGLTGDEFLGHIKPALPFLCDFETIKWHRDQGTTIEKPDAIEAADAVRAFLAWMDLVVPDRDSRVLWSWGTTYDFPLLEPLLDLRPPGTPAPWRYHQVRDARTVWKLAFGELKHADRPHEALADTRAAIADVVTALAALKPQLS